MIIYYDSYCKMCTSSSLFWNKMDWRNKLSFKSFRMLDNYPKEMEESLHVYHQDKWYKGFDAIMEVSRKLPLMWILLPFMYLFKWIGLGEFIYKKIAKNRRLVPVNQCDHDGCRTDS
ncbi:DCC1-like thiol-disulfide oxidoreductase family protein [Virgibacillus sp. L01]|uniref:DCC1-like thiol-disulfide oxidoreductase family protein n=1 Tax=Virgibacillus sp. L01 TaxID=3457429 RepID=UPI003FCF1BC8